jgi:hypothetical protein
LYWRWKSRPRSGRPTVAVVVAGSLIASRSQFAHAAYKTPHFEIFEWFFSQCVIIALSGEPSN